MGFRWEIRLCVFSQDIYIHLIDNRSINLQNSKTFCAFSSCVKRAVKFDNWRCNFGLFLSILCLIPCIAHGRFYSRWILAAYFAVFGYKYFIFQCMNLGFLMFWLSYC